MLQLSGKTFNPEILYICDSIRHAPDTGQRHAHDFVEISVVLDGESQYTIENKTFTAKAGTIMVFNPGVHHQDDQLHETHSRQLHIGIRNFSLAGYERNYFPFASPIICLGDLQQDFIHSCWHLIQENNQRQYGYEVMMKSLIMKLIILILRSENSQHIEPAHLKKSTTEKEKQQLVNNIIYFLEKHHSEDITLDMISDKMYISSTYISKIFKEETGDSPINYLIKLRLQRAKELLKTEKITVKEAAQLVGYHDAYHFSKLFKKYYGKSPSEYLIS